MIGIFIFPIAEKFYRQQKLMKEREDEDERNKLMMTKMEETITTKIKEEEEGVKLKEKEREDMIAKIDKEEEKIENFLHVVSCNHTTPFEWEKSNKIHGMVTDGNGKSIEMRRLLPSMMIAVADNFFTPQECQYILERMRGVELKNPDDFTMDGKHMTDKSLITQRETTLPSDVIIELVKKIKPFIPPPCSNLVIKYKLYRAEDSKEVGITPHVDIYDYTLLIYLNTVSEEAHGCTIFNSMRLKIQPVEGRLLWFRNNFCGTKMSDSRLIHSGDKLLSGTKSIIQIGVNIPNKRL